MDAFHLYLDSADLTALKQLLPNPLVYGVTTNPTLLKRAGVAWQALPRLADELFGLGVRALHLQVGGETSSEMVASGLESPSSATQSTFLSRFPRRAKVSSLPRG